MRRPLLMPKLGLTMTEGVLSDWLVQPGGRFSAGDGLFVVETEKISNEIAADADGELLEATVAAGETVACGAVLGYWQDRSPDGRAVDGMAEVDGVGADAGRVPLPDGARIVASPLARRLALSLDVRAPVL